MLQSYANLSSHHSAASAPTTPAKAPKSKNKNKNKNRHSAGGGETVCCALRGGGMGADEAGRMATEVRMALQTPMAMCTNIARGRTPMGTRKRTAEERI